MFLSTYIHTIVCTYHQMCASLPVQMCLITLYYSQVGLITLYYSQVGLITLYCSQVGLIYLLFLLCMSLFTMWLNRWFKFSHKLSLHPIRLKPDYNINSISYTMSSTDHCNVIINSILYLYKYAIP